MAYDREWTVTDQVPLRSVQDGMIGRSGERLRVSLGLFNAFDEQASDIRYFHESQLPGEAAPVEDIHFHPIEPRTLRLTVEARL